VVPYLTEEQVTSLAEDLHAQPAFHYWIAEYFAPETYGWFKSKKRLERFKNAPFQFFPSDWFGLFRSGGWSPRETRYLAEEGKKLGREIPFPLWVRLLVRLTSKEKASRASQSVAYVVFGRQSADS
jgi:hypothetical protein